MNPPSITVVLPAFNEEANLPAILPTVADVLSKIPGRHEILLVNDGSVDRTSAVAHSLTASIPILRVIDHPHNLGYGAAQRTGFQNASGELIFVNSADGQIPADQLLQYLPAAAKADIVVGRYRRRPDAWIRRAASRAYHAAMLLMFGLRLRNINAPKLYHRRVIQSISFVTNGAFTDGEIMVRARARGHLIAEVAIECLARRHGASSVNWRRAWLTFLEVVRFRLGGVRGSPRRPVQGLSENPRIVP